MRGHNCSSTVVSGVETSINGQIERIIKWPSPAMGICISLIRAKGVPCLVNESKSSKATFLDNFVRCNGLFLRVKKCVQWVVLVLASVGINNWMRKLPNRVYMLLIDSFIKGKGSSNVYIRRLPINKENSNSDKSEKSTKNKLLIMGVKSKG